MAMTVQQIRQYVDMAFRDCAGWTVHQMVTQLCTHGPARDESDVEKAWIGEVVEEWMDQAYHRGNVTLHSNGRPVYWNRKNLTRKSLREGER